MPVYDTHENDFQDGFLCKKVNGKEIRDVNTTEPVGLMTLILVQFVR